LATFLKAVLRHVCPTTKTAVPNPTSRGDPNQIHTSKFLSYPLVHQKIWWPKNFRVASFFTDIRPFKYIKKNILNKVVPLFEVGKLLTMNFVLPKGIQTSLMAKRDTSSIQNNGTIRRYMIIVQYSIGDICWPNPSIWIIRWKYRACVACKHPKTTFCLVVMSNFTSISRTLLLIRTLIKICCAL